MPTSSDIAWFKDQFSDQIEQAVSGTAFDIDMVTAVACQETGYIWQRLRTRDDMTVEYILKLCVGDTIDARRAFPKSRAELEEAPRGTEMFAIARAALEEMARYVSGYSGTVKNPNKFCHGYGIFQYDIQFFLNDPDYFLSESYTRFDASLGKCIEELESAQQRLHWRGRTSLSDMEKAAVAIAYNSGSYDPQRGLKQGYFDGSKYYGENFYAYMKLSQSVAGGGHPVPVGPTEPSSVVSLDYKVISTRPLNLRASPDITSRSLGTYANGQLVHVISRSGNWALVDVDGKGSADGYMWADYLAAA
ncbi:SH3 domain-containing protein [Flavisphingomonas formosensis]|uniref:SH3 domain-containing protein n=1 Tax=Flavisphingomonas formosensis TaxID=861534 RepID=UPI0012F8A08A|nr:SH3 domain-containing protein [Sphingomonas formosensis]